MEGKTSLKVAKKIFKSNFIGPDEILGIRNRFPLEIPMRIPVIPFDSKYLESKARGYILVLGLSGFNNVCSTLNFFRQYLGINSRLSEPCFYNQDWYLKESFFNKPLPTEWFLIRKSVIEESRSISPSDYPLNVSLPSAIQVAYTFITYFLINKETLWINDFVWCSDRDVNGDQIYVGRYKDPTGINCDGFSIHRHLSIRKCYGIIDFQ